MDWFAKAFIKSSLTWLGLGVTLGVCMAIHPLWTIYRPAHEHMNLLGFVTMMIYGVGYHVFPRFVGRPLYSGQIAGTHWWVANGGLAAMVVGLFLRPHEDTGTLGTIVLSTGGALVAIGAYAFIYNIWKTLDASRAKPEASVSDVVPLRRRPAH